MFTNSSHFRENETIIELLIVVFWCAMSCSLAGGSTLNMEAVCPYETLVVTQDAKINNFTIVKSSDLMYYLTPCSVVCIEESCSTNRFIILIQTTVHLRIQLYSPHWTVHSTTLLLITSC